MAAVRPITDLRDRFDDITQTAWQSGQPILLTDDKKGNLLLMSQNAYETLLFNLQVDLKLRQAELETQKEEILIPSEEVFQSLWDILREE